MVLGVNGNLKTYLSLETDSKAITNWLQIDYKLITNWLQIDYKLITNWLQIDYKLITKLRLHIAPGVQRIFWLRPYYILLQVRYVLQRF